jgi:alcohol dehydrogenase YqhD (iron-dependent ADH family)
VEASLKEHHIEFVELGGVQPNPVLSLAEKGGALCRKEQIDLVLAVGGGSVIDSAKGIAVSAANQEVSLWSFVSKEKIPREKLCRWQPF